MDDLPVSPFQELPEALVEEMLSKSEAAGEQLYNAFKEIKVNRDDLRKNLAGKGLLSKDSDYGSPDVPTTSGVDGSYGVERLLSSDIVAAAAVAMEGLVPPSEKRYWAAPHHRVFIKPMQHNADSGTIVRGIMMTMELDLASKAPHEVILVDGSMTTPFIYLNQSLNAISGCLNLKDDFLSRIDETLQNYLLILESQRTDKSWAGLPKYTVKREIGEILKWSEAHDDRALLTSILEAGEMTKPIHMIQPTDPWHLNIPADKKASLGDIVDKIIMALKNIYVFYYKPHSWTPAFRVEVSSSVALNRNRLAVVLQALRSQCITPSIMECFPLYIADRMVKHLAYCIPAFRQIMTQHMANKHTGDVGEIFLGMHGYRTEIGR
jgi:hypothetical protein